MGKSKWTKCGRKNRYRDEHTANYYRKMYEKQRGKKLDYYWCPYCSGFHLTSMEVNMKYYSRLEVSDEAVAVG